MLCLYLKLLTARKMKFICIGIYDAIGIFFLCQLHFVIVFNFIRRYGIGGIAVSPFLHPAPDGFYGIQPGSGDSRKYPGYEPDKR